MKNVVLVKNVILALPIALALTVGTAQAHTLELVRAAGKMEANLWEAAAAVLMHDLHSSKVADELALKDYADDVETVNEALAEIKAKKGKVLAAEIADVEASWAKFQELSAQHLKNVDADSHGSRDAYHGNLIEYWETVEEADHAMDELIDALTD